MNIKCNKIETHTYVHVSITKLSLRRYMIIDNEMIILTQYCIRCMYLDTTTFLNECNICVTNLEYKKLGD